MFLWQTFILFFPGTEDSPAPSSVNLELPEKSMAADKSEDKTEPPLGDEEKSKEPTDEEISSGTSR